MHPRNRIAAEAAFILLALLVPVLAKATSAADSAWRGPGLLVSASLNAQERAALVNSSDGAYLVAWQDGRYVADEPDVYVQKLLGDGTVASGWPEDGALAVMFPGSQSAPQICSDGAGGVLVVWEDTRTGGVPRIFAQHLSSTGLVVSGWPNNGKAMSAVTSSQLRPKLVPDGAGGALVFWEDYRLGQPRIYTQHVLAGGGFAAGWPDTGRALAPIAGGQVTITAVPDGAGGALVSWLDGRNGGASSIDVFAHRMAGNGQPAAGWPANGSVVCAAAGAQDRPTIAADGVGGALLAWSDSRDGAYTTYVQRLTTNGGISSGWPVNGIPMSTTAPLQFEPVIAADGTGGALVAWIDARGGVDNADVYAQRLDGTGAALWTVDGVAVCTAPGDQLGPRLIHDGTGGAILCWQDARSAPDTRLYAQHLDGLGEIALGWVADGKLIADSNLVVEAPVLIPDGDGGAVCAWSGAVVPAKPTGEDLFAARFTGSGVVPALASLVAADATPRAVTLRWSTAWASEYVSVERTTAAAAGESGWETLGDVRVAADGEVAWRDATVVAGARYGYRLRGADGVAGETWIEVPRAKLALARVGGLDRVTLAVSLADATPATLELFDVSGRKRQSVELEGTALISEVPLESTTLEPGIYLARLTQSAERATLRIAIAR